MKTLFPLFLLLTGLIISGHAKSQRTEIPFNQEWLFSGGSVSGETINETVTLPHTWNALDAQEGIAYHRGEGSYEKHFFADENWKGRRIFLRFEGVMTIATVYLNGERLGEHRGGYSAFIFELTDQLDFGQENQLKVMANNEYTLEVLPLFGDFNIYGGIYRPVQLLITPKVCISPLDFASPGIYLKQSNVSQSSAEVEVEVKISNASTQNENIALATTIFDAERNIIETQTEDFTAARGQSTYTKSYKISQPKLWNGKKDAHLYAVKVDIVRQEQIIDSRTEPLGLRYFRVDPDEGFFLNEEHMPLHGVSRHQDRKDKGNAISYADHKQDMELMLEMGINALRLAHYQHAETIYDLADTAGIVVWAELPWVGGPGALGGGSNGYEPTEAFHSNARQQLLELIRQNFNHPSICFWSIFNEIQNPEESSPVPFINELNDLTKAEDPSRLTVGASMLKPEENIHNITDAIAWNRYFGWYYGEPAGMADFLDDIHANHPEWCIGISEYGAGASIAQHSQKLKKPNPFGSPHPEQWQGYYVEEHLKIYNDRPFVWGTFLWNMFDFGSHFRREGDHYGINDKGLITFDRKVKKDAFFFFKANWSKEPVLHLTSKRHIFRDNETTPVKVYSNLPLVKLLVNGEIIGEKAPADGVVQWEDIVLHQGNNGIKVVASANGETFTDGCVWVLDTAFGAKQMAKIIDLMKFIPHAVVAGLLILFWLGWKSWRKRYKTAKWKRSVAKIFFFVVLLALLLIVAFQILVRSSMGG